MDKPIEYTLTWEVTDDMTAKRIGGAGAKILSTPNMIALMEATALPSPILPRTRPLWALKSTAST